MLVNFDMFFNLFDGLSPQYFLADDQSNRIGSGIMIWYILSHQNRTIKMINTVNFKQIFL